MVVSVLVSKASFKPAVLIPVYDHEEAIGLTLEEVLQYDCKVLLVDDGSGVVCRETLVALSNKYPESVSLLRLEQNMGKGAAVKQGFKALFAEGYSHAVQIDADGQHDLGDLLGFLKESEAEPDAVIAGYPEYDESVPKTRYYGRYLTHIWVWINTLSFQIKDSMCGFRVYPLAGIVEQLKQQRCGDRMDFDSEIIVHWSWRGGRVLNRPIKVRYPLDGVSHFDVLHDNLRITAMHTRLFFGMLWRLPGLLRRKFSV